MPNTEYVFEMDKSIGDSMDGSREYDCMMYYELVRHYFNMAQQKKHVSYNETLLKLHYNDQKSNSQKKEE